METWLIILLTVGATAFVCFLIGWIWISRSSNRLSNVIGNLLREAFEEATKKPK